MTLKRGRHPASNRPKKKRVASNPEYLWHAAIAACAMPHPRTRHGIRMRCGTLTIRMDEKGCHANCAMGAMLPTNEYWFPTR
jgi:hypothetical protein